VGQGDDALELAEPDVEEGGEPVGKAFRGMGARVRGSGVSDATMLSGSWPLGIGEIVSVDQSVVDTGEARNSVPYLFTVMMGSSLG